MRQFDANELSTIRDALISTVEEKDIELNHGMSVAFGRLRNGQGLRNATVHALARAAKLDLNALLDEPKKEARQNGHTNGNGHTAAPVVSSEVLAERMAFVNWLHRNFEDIEAEDVLAILQGAHRE